MRIIQTAHFRKIVKKLHINQKRALDAAIREIIANPSIGTTKTGDLTEVQVFKFNMVKQLTLLAYTYSDKTITLTLLSLGSHGNFYRDLKKKIYA